MEIRLVVFLAFASVTVVTNTMMIWFAYKALAGISSKVTKTVSDLEKNNEIKQWIDSLQIASEQAVVVTQSTKEQITGFEPVLVRAQEGFARSLAATDAKLNELSEQITNNATKMRDTVSKPASSIGAFAAGLMKVLETFGSRE
jgi:hypothetical protein